MPAERVVSRHCVCLDHRAHSCVGACPSLIPCRLQVFVSGNQPYPKTAPGNLLDCVYVYASQGAGNPYNFTVSISGTSYLTVHYNGSSGWLYGGCGRRVLIPSNSPTPSAGSCVSSYEQYLYGWSNPAGFASNGQTHFVVSSTFSAVMAVVADSSKVGGGVTWPLATGLDTPGQVGNP